MTAWTSSPRMTDAIANTKQLNAFRSAAAFISRQPCADQLAGKRGCGDGSGEAPVNVHAE